MVAIMTTSPFTTQYRAPIYVNIPPALIVMTYCVPRSIPGNTPML